MASIAADNKGKRPMYPEDDLTEVKPSLPSDPEAGSAGEKKPEGGGAEGGGGGDDLLLVTECGTELRFSRLAARMSTMLYGMMEVGCAVGRIRVPDIDAGTLRLVAAYCEKHGPYYDPATAGRDRDTFLPLPIDFMPAAHAIKPVTEPDPDPHGLNSWDQEFITVGIDITTLCSILLAANYLGIDDLIHLGCTAVADKMKGKTPEQIREAFHIENDYTPEQEAEVRKQNAWAFED